MSQYRSGVELHKDDCRVTDFQLIATTNNPPADAAVAIGQCAIWFDPTPGAAKISFKAKDAAGAVTTGQVGRSAHLLSGLFGYWPMDEVSGTRYSAVGGLSLQATANGEEGGVPGLLGNAHQATGPTYLDVADNAAWAFVGSFTITGWLKMNATNVIQTIAAKWGGAGQCQTALLWNGTNLWGFLTSPDGTNPETASTASPVPVTGQWYFMCGWLDNVAHTVNLQVNNGPVASVASSGPVFHSTVQPNHFHIFYDGTAHSSNGLLDEVGVWTRVLTSGERTALYNGGAGLPFSSFTA